MTPATTRKTIVNLKATIASLTASVENRDERLVEADQVNIHLQSELDVCTGQNDRLNNTIKKERENVQTLKNTAKWFRAQRDRVDAYLSATLDGIDRQNGNDRVCEVSAYDDRPGRTPERTDRRPNTGEPHNPTRMDGMSYQPYRDDEPSNDWENL